MVFSASLFGTVPGAHRAGDQVFPGNLSCAAARAHVERSRSDPVTAFPDRHGACLLYTSLPRHRRKEGHRHPVVELRVLAADGDLQRVLIERFDALAFKLRKINA